MVRRSMTLLAGLIGLVSTSVPAVAAEPSAKKLKAVYWTGGVAHDFEAIAMVLPPALAKLLDTEIKLCRDASFLDSPEAKRLDVILMNHCYENAKGVLDGKRKQALLDLVRGGVGVVAIHPSYYSFVKWDEVHKFYGARFTRHGSSKAVVVVSTVDKKHPIMKGLAEAFEIVTELYESTPLAKDCHVLARAKEKGTTPTHPSVWTRMYGKGRVVTLLPGHWPDGYRIRDFQKLIARSALWAAGRLDQAKAKGKGKGKSKSKSKSKESQQ